MSKEKGKSCSVSDINTVNRIVSERMVKGECVCVFVCLLHCINRDKFVLNNESHAMYQTSGYFRIDMIIPNVNVR